MQYVGGYLSFESAYYGLMQVWQVVAGEVLSPEPDLFIAAIGRAAQSAAAIEASAPAASRALLWQAVALHALQAGLTFHASFHRRIDGRRCGFAPAPLTATSEGSASRALNAWAFQYVKSFTAEHEVPVAIRVAAWLRRHYHERCPILLICAEIGTSRASLLRGFEAAYGTSPLGFASLLRLREAVARMRIPDGNLETTAATVGYGDAKSLAQVLRRHAAVDPGAVMAMSDGDFDSLMNGPLRVPRAFEAVRYLAAPAAAPATSFSTCPSRM
jgi:AraC-like DNA-binding protein